MKTFMKRLRPGDLVQEGQSKSVMNHLHENHLESRWRNLNKKVLKRRISTNNKHRIAHIYIYNKQYSKTCVILSAW